MRAMPTSVTGPAPSDFSIELVQVKSPAKQELAPSYRRPLGVSRLWLSGNRSLNRANKR
jgi:hypothetical protein